jgi:hypothetical protein
MLRKVLPFFVTVVLSVIVSGLATTALLRPQITHVKNTGADRDGMLRTDEQAAQQYLKGQRSFPELSGEARAEKALLSMCAQLRGRVRCASLSDYTYYAQRDDGIEDAAVSFSYRPMDGEPKKQSQIANRLLCDFANESWVICHIDTVADSTLRTYYARTVNDGRDTKLGLRRTIKSKT